MTRSKWFWIPVWVVVVVLGPIAAFYGGLHINEYLRVKDAEPAFRPLLRLQPLILSQPYGSRYCRYVIDFTPESRLTDANIGELRSLNLLPQQNWLDVVISTPAVTDASLPMLKQLRTADILAVTDSSISDEGIEELRREFGRIAVPLRDR